MEELKNQSQIEERLDEALKKVMAHKEELDTYTVAELTNVNNPKVKLLCLLKAEDLKKEKMYLRCIFPLSVVIEKEGKRPKIIPIIPVKFTDDDAVKEIIYSPLYISGANFMIAPDLGNKEDLIKDYILENLIMELQVNLANAAKSAELIEKINKTVSDEKQ